MLHCKIHINKHCVIHKSQKGVCVRNSYVRNTQGILFCTSPLVRQPGKLALAQFDLVPAVPCYFFHVLVCEAISMERWSWRSCPCLWGSTLGVHCTVGTLLSARPGAITLGACSCGGQLWFADNAVVSVEDAHFSKPALYLFFLWEKFWVLPLDSGLHASEGCCVLISLA